MAILHNFSPQEQEDHHSFIYVPPNGFFKNIQRRSNDEHKSEDDGHG